MKKGRFYETTHLDIREKAGGSTHWYCLLCAAAGCSKTNEINDSAAVPANAPVSDSSADSGETPSDDSTADSTAEAGGDTSIHVVAVGDNLVQQCVYQSAQAHSNDGTSYNFDYCYDNINR